MLSLEERTFIVRYYFELKSYKSVQNAFQNKYPNTSVPTKAAIFNLVKKFNTTGSVAVLKLINRLIG